MHELSTKCAYTSPSKNVRQVIGRGAFAMGRMRLKNIKFLKSCSIFNTIQTIKESLLKTKVVLITKDVTA